MPHTTAAREIFIDIPGEETEFFARLARLYGTYIIIQCKARWPEIMADRFFNTLFVVSPQDAASRPTITVDDESEREADRETDEQ